MTDNRQPPTDHRPPTTDNRPPNTGNLARSAADLEVYKRAYRLAMEVFAASKTWPREEQFSLTDQIRRSSRAVCANLRESWAKRRYPNHFVSKLTDADAENAETQTWLDFARDCGYISDDTHARLLGESKRVGRMLGTMLKQPDGFLVDDGRR